MNQRFYQASDIKMLTACDVIADHALENLAALEAVNPAWGETYFKEIKERILALLRDVFGIKSVKRLRRLLPNWLPCKRHYWISSPCCANRSLLLTVAMLPARRRSSTTLAIQDTGKSQTTLIAMLEIFEKGCTPALLEEFAVKKISSTSVGVVRDNLRRMFELNVVQEGKKDSRKLITSDTVDQFNAVYNDTMLYDAPPPTES